MAERIRNHRVCFELSGGPLHLDFTSTINHVSAKTPPAFLWFTATDELHLCRENLLFVQALSKHDLPFELHIFSKGHHGLGLGEDEPAVAAWPKLCADWLRRLWGIG